MGLHLRGKRHQAAEAGRFHWRVDEVWPRLRDEVQKRKGGLFVAADGHLALLRNALESRAWEDGIAVLTSAQIKFHFAAAFYDLHAIDATPARTHR